MATDPRVEIAKSPMTLRQILAIGMCVALNALDGFDVLAISFASPGIASDWGIDRAALGLVLSMELIGMAVGSVLLGNVADRIGRRPTVIGCLIVMASGMWLATLANNVEELSVYRLLTGLGVGGMLSCTSALAAEYASDRARNLAVAIMAAGFPMGAVLGGTVASSLLANGDWRDVFTFGAIVTGIFLPIIWFLLPESVSYLLQRRPDGVADKVNHALKAIGHAPVDTLPDPVEGPATPSTMRLFSPALRPITLLLTIGYLSHIMTFYFILKWIPKIVVDMGFHPSAAGGVLVWANVGGLLGALLLSALSWRMAIRTLVIAAMLGSAAMVVLFGQGQSDLTQLGLIAAITGFCTNAGVVGLYAIIASSFPTEVLAGGTGFVIGVGRGGAALGPIVAGLLFSLDFGLPVVAIAMAGGSLVAAISLIALRSKA